MHNLVVVDRAPLLLPFPATISRTSSSSVLEELAFCPLDSSDMLESDTSKLASSPKSCQGHRRAYSSSMSLPRPAHADDGSQYRRRSVMAVGHQPSYTNGFFDGGPNQSSRFLLPTRKLVRMFLWALVILLALSVSLADLFLEA